MLALKLPVTELAGSQERYGVAVAVGDFSTGGSDARESTPRLNLERGNTRWTQRAGATVREKEVEKLSLDHCEPLSWGMCACGTGNGPAIVGGTALPGSTPSTRARGKGRACPRV